MPPTKLLGSKKSYDAAIAAGKDPHEECRKEIASMESMYKEEHELMVQRLRAKLEHKGTKLERLRGKLERSQNAELLLRWNNNDIKALYIALSKENEYLRDEITEANIELAENAQSDYSQANYGRKAREPGFMRKEEEAAGIFQHEIPIRDEEGDHSDTSTWGPCPKKRRRGDVLPEPADEHVPQMPVGHTHKEMDKLYADMVKKMARIKQEYIAGLSKSGYATQ